MAKNRTFTGGKQSARTPALSKDAQFQIMRLQRKLMKEARERNEPRSAK